MAPTRVMAEFAVTPRWWELLAGAGGEVRAEGPPLHAGKEARLGSEARCPRMGATRSCGLYLRFDPVDGGATLTGPLGLGCDWVG